MLKMTQVISSLIGIIILCSCSAEPEVAQPVEVNIVPAQAEVVEEIPNVADFVIQGHEQARDVVVAYVADLAGLPLPEGEWNFQDQGSQSPADALTWLFTNGPCAVEVSAPAIIPQQVVYSVTVDHLSAVIRWEGTIDSAGKIIQMNYIQGSTPESPAKPGEPSWVGVVVSAPQGAQFDDYFQLMGKSGTRSGIEGADNALKEQLVVYRDSRVAIRVWGILLSDVPDAYGTQILVTRIEPE
jgi:hypothetical protein